MAKAKKRSSRIRTVYRSLRRRHHSPISILTALPIVHKTVLEPLLGDATRGIDGVLKKDGDTTAQVKEYFDVLGINFLGWKFSDSSWWGWMSPIKTYGEILLGAVGSKVATKVGANRMIAKVPVLGKYIKL